MVSAVEIGVGGRTHLHLVGSPAAAAIEPAGPPLLSARERRVVAALAEAAMPAGARFDAGGAHTIPAFEAWLRSIPAHLAQGLRAGYLGLEAFTVATHLRPFSSLSLEARAELVKKWE